MAKKDRSISFAIQYSLKLAHSVPSSKLKHRNFMRFFLHSPKIFCTFANERNNIQYDYTKDQY